MANHSFSNPQKNYRIVFDKLKRDFTAFLDNDYLQAAYQAATSNTSPQQVRARLQKESMPFALKDYVKAMNSLGFVNINQIQITEEKLMTELWASIGGSEENTVPAYNVMVALAGVMGLVIEETIPSQPTKAVRRKGFVSYDNLDNLYFASEGDLEQFHKKYMWLSANRKNKRRELKESFSCTFRPEISSNSRRMVESRLMEASLPESQIEK